MIERKDALVHSFTLGFERLELFEGGASGSVAHDFALSESTYHRPASLLRHRWSLDDRQPTTPASARSYRLGRSGLAEFLSEGLTIAGFWTSVIASALQTLEVFRLRTFDLIIVDAALDGLGAEQLLVRLLGGNGSAASTDRPVIIFAGSDEEMTPERAEELGRAHLLRPSISNPSRSTCLASSMSGGRSIRALWADEDAQTPGD
ncbi:MAG: hypothetical protein R2845_06695 [Thermomicrobiales bacterium]